MDLNATNWICGCPMDAHPRFACPKMTEMQQRLQTHMPRVVGCDFSTGRYKTSEAVIPGHRPEAARWPEPGRAPLASKPPLGPRRALQPTEHLPVTWKMLYVATIEAQQKGWRLEGADLSALYRAMRALEPPSDAERIALTRANIAEGRVKELEARLAAHDKPTPLSPKLWSDESVRALHVERDEFRAACDNLNSGWINETYDLRCQLADRDARIAELKSELAARPKPAPAPDAPASSRGPFREFPVDRRRIGR